MKNLLYMNYDAGTKLEYEGERGEEPHSTKKHLESTVFSFILKHNYCHNLKNIS